VALLGCKQAMFQPGWGPHASEHRNTMRRNRLDPSSLQNFSSAADEGKPPKGRFGKSEAKTAKLMEHKSKNRKAVGTRSQKQKQAL
jgi:hypothetical protein